MFGNYVKDHIRRCFHGNLLKGSGIVTSLADDAFNKTGGVFT